MERIDACNLSVMLEAEYGQEFNIPYLIMENQRLMDIEIWPEEASVEFLQKYNEDFEHMDAMNVFETLINDLCFRKKLKAGSYLMSFDD